MPTSILRIRKLELSLNLGWGEKERSKERKVLLDIAISFPESPKACASDELRDTVCYATLSQVIREKVSAKPYRLIEHLSSDIYTLVKNQIPKNAKLKICITKFPAIGGLKEGVSFEYGDEI